MSSTTTAIASKAITAIIEEFLHPILQEAQAKSSEIPGRFIDPLNLDGSNSPGVHLKRMAERHRKPPGHTTRAARKKFAHDLHVRMDSPFRARDR